MDAPKVLAPDSVVFYGFHYPRCLLLRRVKDNISVFVPLFLPSMYFYNVPISSSLCPCLALPFRLMELGTLQQQVGLTGVHYFTILGMGFFEDFLAGVMALGLPFFYPRNLLSHLAGYLKLLEADTISVEFFSSVNLH